MKKMSFCSAIVLLLSFCLGGCGQPQPNPKLDDLNLLCETLETEHYDLYANVSEEEFQDERKKIARQTPNMTDAEFYWSPPIPATTSCRCCHGTSKSLTRAGSS